MVLPEFGSGDLVQAQLLHLAGHRKRVGIHEPPVVRNCVRGHVAVTGSPPILASERRTIAQPPLREPTSGWAWNDEGSAHVWGFPDGLFLRGQVVALLVGRNPIQAFTRGDIQCLRF